MTVEERTPHSKDAVLRDKAVRLFTYLKEFVQLRWVATRDCLNYESVLWFYEVPREQGCFSVAWGAPREDDDVWLEVQKQSEPRCPAVPQACQNWVDPAEVSDSERDPELRSVIAAPSLNASSEPAGELEGSPSFLKLEDHPQVQELWLRYLIEQWNPWAERHRRWKSVQRIYGELFSMYSRQKKLGEEYELLLGLGLLTWIPPSNQRVRRHLLAAQANLLFDANRGVLSVRAAAEGAKLSIETDMLEPDERPILEQQRAVEEMVRQATESPWDLNLVEPALRMWINALDPKAAYNGGAVPPSELVRTPAVTFAPALILRKRTARNLVSALANVVDQIRKDGEIPFGVRRLCQIVEDLGPQGEASVETTKAASSGLPDAEVYFPLLTNDEQRRIVHRLQTSQGVLVQGPPGTGKSHTIANLICHLLATGKRVLVTSQTPRALKVLKGMIPPQVSPLCVSVLGNDVAAMDELKDSVQAISERYHNWNLDRSAREITGLERQAYDLKKRQAEVQRQLRELREQETYRHTVAGGKYQGTAASIGKAIRENSALHGWFPDAIGKDTELPFSCPVFLRFLHACRRLTAARCEELSQRAVTSARVPNTPAFLELRKAEATASEQWEGHKDRDASPAFLRLRTVPQAIRTRLGNALHGYLGAMARARSRDFPWVSVAIKEVVTGHATPWKSLQETSAKCLAGLRRRSESADARSIRFPAQADREKLRQDPRDLLAHLNAGGGLGWWRLRPKVVKRTLYLTTEVSVSGRHCDSPQPLRELIEQLEVDRQLDNHWSQWLHRTERPKGSRLHQVTTAEEHLQTLTEVIELQKPLEVATGVAAEIAGLPEPAWFDEGTINSLLADLDAADANEKLLGARARFDTHIAALQAVTSHPNAHPVNASLLKALRERDLSAYGAALHELEELEADLALKADRDELLRKLHGVAPHLAASMLESPDDPKWDNCLAAIEEAWAWACADAWLRDFHGRGDGRALEEELRRTEKTLRGKLAELAAAKAWRECFRRMKEEHRQYLLAWSKEIKLIGKGTGKYAGHHRRVAQKHMEQCREAIPAWVMPFYRIAETIPARPNTFDVVIIDEASQSGPEALLLSYLGKQVLVVGDDQQISPDFVGFDQAKVQALLEQYLHDFEFKNTFGVGYSLFAHADIRYKTRIVLREHFRCMPEIIRFSNDLCYRATPLMPLRQYPPQRLEPIVVRHVPQGFREGGAGAAINRPEAEVLVEDVVRCCSDTTYAGKTMGVISLQGEYQARLIEQLLRERLDESEIDRRNIVCGDAYAFQGDERDLIFLTMVAAPNAPIGALTKEADKRRFNVAASRARDQVRLFHTATLNDLNPEDMRCKVLAYYTNPAAPVFAGPDWDRCGSNFERDVGQRIHAREYRVLVQYEPLGPGGKRIDLVIEGMKTRLAVECDGDYWHGPDKYEEDMRRQRQLERAGLVFWRIRQSEFERDPEKALDPLWRLLPEMEIYPVGQQARSSTTKESAQPATDLSGPKSPLQVSTSTVSPAQRADGPLTEMPSVEGDGAACEPGVTPYGDLAKRVDEIPQDKVREALYAGLPANGRIEREVLLRSAAHYLGFSKLGSRVRTRLNRTIGAEKRAGRLDTDWVTVWRVESEQNGETPDPSTVGTAAQPVPLQGLSVNQTHVAKAILNFVQGQLFGVSKDKIPAAVAEQLGLQKMDQEVLRLVEQTIADLADRGLLSVKGGAVHSA